MRIIHAMCVVGLCATSVICTAARAQEPAAGNYTIQKTLHIGGEGRWDYIAFDEASKHLYVTRTTHTQVIDPADGKVLADIPGQKNAHGTAIVSSAGRGFISDGGEGNVLIFDLKTNETLGKISAADDADGIIYDAGTNKVLVACGDAAKLVVLPADADPKNGKADFVDLGGKPEYLAADGKGNVYVNINDKNQIAAVDLKTMKVTNRWPTGTGKKPTGLAIDVEHHLLFVGCRNERLIVMSTEDGHVVKEVAIGKGNDACAYDAGTGQVFASCGEGSVTAVTNTFEPNMIMTKPLARTLAIDPASHTLYLPTAETAGPAAQGKWPEMKPDSFMILVVAPGMSK